MNIHLPAILMFTRGTGFWPIPIYEFNGLKPIKTHSTLAVANKVEETSWMAGSKLRAQNHPGFFEKNIGWVDGKMFLGSPHDNSWKIINKKHQKTMENHHFWWLTMVNWQFANWKITICHGKIHYFYGHVQQLFLCLPGRVKSPWCQSSTFLGPVA